MDAAALGGAAIITAAYRHSAVAAWTYLTLHPAQPSPWLCSPKSSLCCSCHARITKLERIPKDAGVFISPLTLQSFRTQADLASHAQKLGAQLMQLMGGGTGGMPSMPQLAVMQAGQQQGWKPPPPPLPAGGFGRPPPQHMPRYQHGVAARPQQVHPQAQQAPWPRQAGVPS